MTMVPNGPATTTLATTPTPGSGSLVVLTDKASDYAARARADNTVAGYSSDVRHFEAWADERGVVALPASPATLGAYLADLAEWAKPATISRRLSAIAALHELSGHPSPTKDPWVRLVHSGIRRSLGTRPKGKDAISLDELRAMVDAQPEGTLGDRNRMLLLVGFCGALRRSELVALCHEDLRVVNGGMVALLRRSKTDQHGAGREIALPASVDRRYCPVAAITTWQERSGITAGPLLRAVDRWGTISEGPLSGRAVPLIVQDAARRAGIENPERLGAHSLRVGFCTAAAGVASERAIAAQTGHRSTAVLRGYIRARNVLDGNAASTLGL